VSINLDFDSSAQVFGWPPLNFEYAVWHIDTFLMQLDELPRATFLRHNGRSDRLDGN